MIDFAQNHPTAAFFIAWLAAWAVTRPFYFAFLAYKRLLRSRNIAAHGWPTAPIDADGDVIYEEKDQDKSRA